MSKYFSFLRKKRTPSLQEEERDSPPSKTKRKHAAKKLLSQSSQSRSLHSLQLMKQTEENRLSVHSIGYYDDSKESVDLLHSDNDSLLDNVSFGEVFLEEDVVKKVEDKSGVEVEERKVDLDEDEGHVVDDGNEEDNDDLIDDFMEEAFDDLEDDDSEESVNEEKQRGGSTDPLQVIDNVYEKDHPTDEPDTVTNNYSNKDPDDVDNDKDSDRENIVNKDDTHESENGIKENSLTEDAQHVQNVDNNDSSILMNDNVQYTHAKDDSTLLEQIDSSLKCSETNEIIQSNSENDAEIPVIHSILEETSKTDISEAINNDILLEKPSDFEAKCETSEVLDQAGDNTSNKTKPQLNPENETTIEKFEHSESSISKIDSDIDEHCSENFSKSEDEGGGNPNEGLEYQEMESEIDMSSVQKEIDICESKSIEVTDINEITSTTNANVDNDDKKNNSDTKIGEETNVGSDLNKYADNEIEIKDELNESISDNEAKIDTDLNLSENISKENNESVASAENDTNSISGSVDNINILSEEHIITSKEDTKPDCQDSVFQDDEVELKSISLDGSSKDELKTDQLHSRRYSSAQSEIDDDEFDSAKEDFSSSDEIDEIEEIEDKSVLENLKVDETLVHNDQTKDSQSSALILNDKNVLKDDLPSIVITEFEQSKVTSSNICEVSEDICHQDVKLEHEGNASKENVQIESEPSSYSTGIDNEEVMSENNKSSKDIVCKENVEMESEPSNYSTVIDNEKIVSEITLEPTEDIVRNENVQIESEPSNYSTINDDKEIITDISSKLSGDILSKENGQIESELSNYPTDNINENVSEKDSESSDGNVREEQSIEEECINIDDKEIVQIDSDPSSYASVNDDDGFMTEKEVELSEDITEIKSTDPDDNTVNCEQVTCSSQSNNVPDSDIKTCDKGKIDLASDSSFDKLSLDNSSHSIEQGIDCLQVENTTTSTNEIGPIQEIEEIDSIDCSNHPRNEVIKSQPEDKATQDIDPLNGIVTNQALTCPTEPATFKDKEINQSDSTTGIPLIPNDDVTKPLLPHNDQLNKDENRSKPISQPVLSDNDLGESITKRVVTTSEENFLINTVNSDHVEAEARLAQRRAARAEARELRLRELEKQQQEQGNNEEEEQYAANSSITPATDCHRKGSCALRHSSLYPKTPTRTPTAPRVRTSLPTNTVSRRSSEDSTPDDGGLPSSARELKVELKELDDKFRKAMITNASLDNEKATLTFEVDFLKDKYSELEENHIQLKKEHRKKSSENETLRKVSNKLKEEVKQVRRVLQERDELIQEYGLVVIGDENGAGDDAYDDYDDTERRDDTCNALSPRNIGVKKALLSHEASDLLAKGAAEGSLDVRLRKYADAKHDLEDEIRRLKMELEEELSRRRKENGIDYEKQKEASKSLNEYKFRIQKAEAEVSTLQANVVRLESLVGRYKSSAEELEKSEEELKSEKRRLQRELREAQNRLEELELTTSHLQKRFDKLKTARSTLLKDLSLDPT